MVYLMRLSGGSAGRQRHNDRKFPKNRRDARLNVPFSVRTREVGCTERHCGVPDRHAGLCIEQVQADAGFIAHRRGAVAPAAEAAASPSIPPTEAVPIATVIVADDLACAERVADNTVGARAISRGCYTLGG